MRTSVANIALKGSLTARAYLRAQRSRHRVLRTGIPCPRSIQKIEHIRHERAAGIAAAPLAGAVAAVGQLQAGALSVIAKAGGHAPRAIRPASTPASALVPDSFGAGVTRIRQLPRERIGAQSQPAVGAHDGSRNQQSDQEGYDGAHAVKDSKGPHSALLPLL